MSPVSWSRAASPATRRSASRSSRCGTGRIIPTSSSGTCCAAFASRPHKATLAWSAHCRSSTTRMVGRTAHCSATSASNCSASTAGTSVPRSAATSPRSSRTIVFRRGLADGSRTRKPSRNGSSGSAWPSSSPAPQNTSQPVSGASATAARTSADLPMPGSPSMSTELPCPRATSFMSPVSSAISLSRPTSAPAGVTGCMQRTLLPEHLRNKRHYSDINSVSAIIIRRWRPSPHPVFRARKVARKVSPHKIVTLSLLQSQTISEQLTVKAGIQYLVFEKTVCGELP